METCTACCLCCTGQTVGLSQSDQWTEPVRPVTTAAAQQVFQRASMTSPSSGTKTLPKHNLHRRKTLQKAWQLQTDQELTCSTTTQRNTSQAVHPRQIPQSDRSRTPVRPIKPGQLGMKSTCGSTPPNPNLDLPNRSTDLCKTLGIVGTPHEESIAKFLSIKTCQIKRNRRNPTKNSSNPRTQKPQNRAP
jgi:hypothetical protein